MAEFISFVKDNWLICLIGFLIIVVVVNFLLRAMFKVALIFVVIGVVLVLFFNYTPNQVVDMGKGAVTSANTLYQKTVKPIIDAEVHNASYDIHEDGTYEIKTKSLRIAGVSGQNVVTIYYKDKSFKMDVDKLGTALQQHIEEASKQAEAKQNSTK